MIFKAYADGRFELGERVTPCTLGWSGVIAADRKREGDGASPAGLWPMRRVLFRADRLARPITSLPAADIGPRDGWCDDPADEAYNRPVPLPYARSAERLWREDGLYDLIVVLGYNDAPVIVGAGSAIFLHVAAPDLAPTQGCVALAARDMIDLLARAQPGDAVAILDHPRGA